MNAIDKKSVYLSKRLLYAAASRAGLKAVHNAMQIAGYIIIAQNGFLVKKYANGHLERIGTYQKAIVKNSVLVD